PGAQTTATATGLVAGNYQVIITDNIGCQDSAAVVITQPPLLTLTSDGIDATCFGFCDGAAIALAAGGVLPYAYLWDDPLSQITDTAVGLCSGIYNATITDNNGCQAFISVNIDQPLSLVSAIIASNNTSCNGLCDGNVTAIAGGGAPPYSFLWDDPGAQTTGTAVALCAGTFTVNITDSNGCTSVDIIVIAEPAALSAGILSNTNASCNAACDAVATGSATGGTGIYAYLWDDPGAQISLTATGLCAGSFSFAVVDVNGCSDTAIVVISEPTALLASISDSNNVSCNGICDGDVTGSASGGTAPYSFLWNDPSAQTNAMALGLCAGPYTVIVTDGNGCVDSVGVVISEPSTLTSSITDSTNNSCSASCDGMATVTPVGGTAPYFYNWDAPGGQTDSTSIGLCAGTWTVGIMDANGCLDTVSVIISEPSLIVPTMSSIDATCGISNGQVSVLAAGGVGPYIYLWDDPGAQTNDTATGLAAGGYSVDVTDATGCVVTGIVTVNNIGAATVTISSITNVSCDGGSDGSATLSAIGGTPPYTYSWDDPAAQGNVTATALVAGIYIGTVMDSLGCIGSAIATITEPAPLNLVISSNDVSCFGACDGSASVAANGGTTPYNYLWSPSGCSDSSCVNLCAGVHTVTLTDANGCTATDSAIISEPIALSATVSSTAISCAGSCDGTATGAATGGTAPYTHMWTDSLGDTIALGSTVTGLCAGNYNLILIDDNGCVSSTAFSLLDPIAISLTLSSTQANCGASDGMASVSVTNGAAPFTYLWDDPAVQTNDTASAIAAGTYNVTVTDANGCTALGSTPVGNSGAPLVSVSATDVACNGTCDGTATLSATGGTLPFTYLWDDPGAQTDTTATGLCAGIYTVMLTDGNGCVAFASDTITESAALTLSGSSINPSCNGLCDGAATVTVTGGTAPYTYAWNDPAVQNTLTATGLCNGTFTVVVVDANGCMDSLSLGITAPTAIGISTSAIDVSSCGSCDGSISSVVSGGTAPYAYTWDDPTIQTTDTAFALCSGIYNLTIVDLNGCSASTSDSVNSPGGLLAIISSSNNISCTGACDGSATITASGGTAPYAYLWNDPSAQTNDAALGLCASTVNCLITDATGCTTTISVTLTEPGSPIGVATSTTAASCAGICDGTANATVTGGLTPYVYLWDDPGAQTTATAAGLCGGAVSVVVTDVNGCTISVSDSVGEGSSLTLVMTGDTLQLLGIDDGVTSVNVTGGSGPYTYLWNDPGAQTDSVATGLSVGTYSVTVTDANGCTASGSAQVEIFDRIGELDLGLSFEVYPNPTNGVVTLAIEFSRHMDFNVQVRNLVGEILLVSSYSGNSSLREDLNLGELPNGVYFISVYTEKGSLNRRIVVSR
ncbi:MAG: T9SS type A sorting domain-containing protein, partial [Flavobacteriales bacterium]|nr:T9SS type A sorting domain-containing protein [Flavobacteriales bacterium]